MPDVAISWNNLYNCSAFGRCYREMPTVALLPRNDKEVGASFNFSVS